MSLKKYKNKYQIIEGDIDKIDIKPYLHCSSVWCWSIFDYDDYDYDDYYDSLREYRLCDNCGKHYCHDYEYCQPYEYIDLPKNDYKIVKKVRSSFGDPYLVGRYIDMESIYSKSELRNRRIDVILGLKEPIYESRVTLGDFFNRIDKNQN